MHHPLQWPLLDATWHQAWPSSCHQLPFACAHQVLVAPPHTANPFHRAPAIAPTLSPCCLQPDLLKLFKGHIAELLRHPHGADVLVDLYDVAPQSGRNAMCAELYGREFVLFDGVATKGTSIGHLRDLLATVPAAKQRSILESLYKEMAPVFEKVGIGLRAPCGGVLVACQATWGCCVGTG
jgi:hypothetical protein